MLGEKNFNGYRNMSRPHGRRQEKKKEKKGREEKDNGEIRSNLWWRTEGEEVGSTTEGLPVSGRRAVYVRLGERR